MPIDHQTTGDSEIEAEPIRLHEQGHGVKGLIFSAHKRQATDWQSGSPLKWDDGQPIWEFVLNIKAEAGKANFSVRDDEGKPQKGADGKTLLEERTFNEQDVCVIASGKGSYQLYKECANARINEGMKVRIARGVKSAGNKVDYEVEVLERDLPLSRYDTDRAAPSGIDHGADERELVESPF
jgi:hypothetical protein